MVIMNKTTNYSNPYKNMTAEQFLQTVKNMGEVARSQDRFTYLQGAGLVKKRFSWLDRIQSIINHMLHGYSSEEIEENIQIIQAVNDLNLKASELIRDKKVGGLKARDIKELANNLHSINERISRMKSKSDKFSINQAVNINDLIKKEIEIEYLKLKSNNLMEEITKMSNNQMQEVSQILHQFKVSRIGMQNFYLEPITERVYANIEEQLEKENHLFLEKE
jgi:hypothetical protein